MSHIYRVMDKYYGIEKAATHCVRVRRVTRKRRYTGRTAARYLAAALLTAACFGVKYIRTPITDKAAEKIRQAVCYDIFDRETGGAVADAFLPQPQESDAEKGA